MDLDAARAAAMYWDAQASTFDEAADHGLNDQQVREAWAARLEGWLGREPRDVLDVGCGTGSLSVLACDLGHRVTGLDLSGAMLRTARLKAGGLEGALLVQGLAEDPPFAPRTFDVVLARHVLWTLEPVEAVRRWCALLRPAGRLVLIEGQWGDAGHTASTLAGAIEGLVRGIELVDLASDDALWGRPVHDERYALLASPR